MVVTWWIVAFLRNVIHTKLSTVCVIPTYLNYHYIMHFWLFNDVIKEICIVVC